MTRLPFRQPANDGSGRGRIEGHLVGDLDDIAAASVNVIRCERDQGETVHVKAVACPAIRDAAFGATVNPGLYSLRVEVARKGRTLYAASDPFVVHSGETVTKAVLLSGKTLITGSVKRDDGSPVAGLLMMAIPMMDFRFSCSVITDDDGLFQIEGLVDGKGADHGIHVTCPRKPPKTELRPVKEGPELRPWSEPFDFILERFEIVECAIIVTYEGSTTSDGTVTARWLLDSDGRSQSELQACVLGLGDNLLTRMQWPSNAPPKRPTVQVESEYGYARLRLRRGAADRLIATLATWAPVVNTVTLTVPDRMLAPDRRGVFLNRHEFNGGRYRQAHVTGNTARFERVIPGVYWIRSLGSVAWEDPYGRVIVRTDGSYTPPTHWLR